MSQYTRHHFVPQFCLRQFATDARRRQIGTFVIKDGRYVGSTSIRNQAQRAKLYGSDEREKALSDLEGAMAALASRMVGTLEVPVRLSEDHVKLLSHVLFQSGRTPTAGAELEDGMNDLMKIVLSRDPKVAPYLDKVRIKNQQSTVLTLAEAGRAMPLALDLRYKLLVNQTGIPFILSDHPVVKYNQFMERKKVSLGCTGLACKGLELFLPLSPTVTLMLYDGDTYRVGPWDDHAPKVVKADVDLLNILQVVNAGSQLYFNAQITAEAIQDLVQRSQQWTRNNRTTVKEFRQPPRESGLERSIIMTSLNDLRIGLRLSKVVELPSAQNFKLTDGMSIIRDQPAGLRRDFYERVTIGQYHESDFFRYLDDVVSGKF